MPDAPRIPPLAEADWDPEIRGLLTGLAKVSGGNVLNIFTTLAHHPELLQRWLGFANHILGASTLPAREREIAILRIGWLCQSEYEWGQHVIIAKRAGLSDEEIARVAAGPEAPGWSAAEATLLRATDELERDAVVSDASWAALERHFDLRQRMDFVFTVGQYRLVSMALRSFGVERDAGVPGFAETAKL